MSVVLGSGGLAVSSGKSVGAGVGASGGVPGLFTGSGIPSTPPPFIGAIYFDTSGRGMYVSDGSTLVTDWKQYVSALHKFHGVIYEEFEVYTSGDDLFKDNNTGAGTNAVALNMSGGVLLMTTGNAAGNENCISYTSGNIGMLNRASKRDIFMCKPSTTTSTIFYMGESSEINSLSGTATSLGFEVNSANAQPTHWYITQNNAGTVTRTDTGIVVDTTSFHRFEIYWDNTGANVTFYIDGVSVGTFGTFAVAVAVQYRLRTVTGGVQTGQVHMFGAVIPRGF